MHEEDEGWYQLPMLTSMYKLIGQPFRNTPEAKNDIHSSINSIHSIKLKRYMKEKSSGIKFKFPAKIALTMKKIVKLEHERIEFNQTRHKYLKQTYSGFFFRRILPTFLRKRHKPRLFWREKAIVYNVVILFKVLVPSLNSIERSSLFQFETNQKSVKCCHDMK